MREAHGDCSPDTHQLCCVDVGGEAERGGVQAFACVGGWVESIQRVIISTEVKVLYAERLMDQMYCCFRSYSI